MTSTRRRGTLSKGTGPEGGAGGASSVECRLVAGRVVGATGGVKWVKSDSGTCGAGEFDFWPGPKPRRRAGCCAGGLGVSTSGVNAVGKWGSADCVDGIFCPRGRVAESFCLISEV